VSGNAANHAAAANNAGAGAQMNAPEAVDDDDDRIDCVCGVNEDRGFMLFCEQCRRWLHGRCVGVTKKTEPEHFYCSRCVAE